MLVPHAGWQNWDPKITNVELKLDFTGSLHVPQWRDAESRLQPYTPRVNNIPGGPTSLKLVFAYLTALSEVEVNKTKEILTFNAKSAVRCCKHEG